MANSTTIARDNIVKASNFDIRKLNYPHAGSSAAFDYNQGDLLWWDSAAGYVKPLDTDGHAATSVGVALRSSWLGPFTSFNVVGGPAIGKNYYADALLGLEVIASFYTTAADTYVDGTAVYCGANAQTITAVVGTNIIGYVKVPSGTAPLGSIAGGAGVLVNVSIVIKSPVLTF